MIFKALFDFGRHPDVEAVLPISNDVNPNHRTIGCGGRILTSDPAAARRPPDYEPDERGSPVISDTIGCGEGI